LKTEGVAFRLFCIGAGTLGKALEMRVRELGLEEHVCFAGYQSAVEDWVRAADLVVLPSPEEPFGLVLLEAMSRGVAVIAANAGGPSEILENGAGMTFKPQDPRDLARKLWRAKEDPHLCEALARAGQERWSEKFTTARMVDGLLEAYEVSVRGAGLVS
jgi:glycosyltransferase involved in cell wall biosynthesis